MVYQLSIVTIMALNCKGESKRKKRRREKLNKYSLFGRFARRKLLRSKTNTAAWLRFNRLAYYRTTRLPNNF